MKLANRHYHKKGHFAKVCRNRSNSKKVNAADEKGGDESTNEEYTYRITLHSVHDKIQPLETR